MTFAKPLLLLGCLAAACSFSALVSLKTIGLPLSVVPSK